MRKIRSIVFNKSEAESSPLLELKINTPFSSKIPNFLITFDKIVGFVRSIADLMTRLDSLASTL